MRNIFLPAGAIILALAGCTSTEEQLPLVFARTQTLGVSVAGSVPEQGGNITLGFSDRNLAVVPTTTRAGESIRSIARDTTNPEAQFDDALSVLGQFEVSSEASAPRVGLGTFFSTGMASRTLAAGFRDRLKGSVAPAPNPRPPVPAPDPGE
jgi:hypothetical protein